MLQLKPTCENCNKPLPPDAMEARICSFECTFCADCVENVLHNVCPNCAGGFVPRPIRPARDWRAGVCVATRPPSSKIVHCPVDAAVHEAFSAPIRGIGPERR
jgi:uncharacterized protein